MRLWFGKCLRSFGLNFRTRASIVGVFGLRRMTLADNMPVECTALAEGSPLSVASEASHDPVK